MLRKDLLGYSLLGLLALFVGQGVASAQAPGAVGQAEPPQPGLVQPGGAKQVNLSLNDQVAAAQTYLSQMETMRNTIRRELEDARQQRDVVKTLCLDDKLNQMDVALRSAGDRKRSLELAAGRNDQELANHEFTILSVLYQRGQQLDAEAKQCIGKEFGFVGESSVTMETEPGLPLEDPTEFPGAILIVEPPNCASCYR